MVGHTRLCVDVEGCPAVAQGARPSEAGVYHRLPQFAAGPFHVNLEAAPGQQSGHAAVSPCRREGGKQVDESHVTLEEHLRYSCGPAEVAVDLERRMGVPKIVQRAVG